MKKTLVLGIETSCDETAVAVVQDERTNSLPLSLTTASSDERWDTPFPFQNRLLSNKIFSQLEEHRPFGGVVPEIAARRHLDCLPDLLDQSLEAACCTLEDIDAIAVTAGPGLIGGVIVGTMAAKGLSAALNKPFYAINHLEGHALTLRLTHELAFPYLLLLVSGGHCQLLFITGVGEYEQLGSTIDDAVGEAFDKTAKLLGLGYPGGPALERCAKAGNDTAFSFPRPLIGQNNFNFSFSGLKTAVRRQVERFAQEGLFDEEDENVSNPTLDQKRADIAASFQRAVAQSLGDRCKRALKEAEKRFGHPLPLAIAGGVSANQYLRKELSDIALEAGSRLVAAPLSLCTDNAAMIAWAGMERIKANIPSNSLDFSPRPRWPLQETHPNLGKHS